MIYLDYAATTPMSETALTAYTEAAQKYYGNANSIHDYGTEAYQIVQLCKQKLSSFIGANETQVYLTSGGSESNLLAIEHLKEITEGHHIIISAGEHNSIRQTEEKLKNEGYEVSVVYFDQDGVININNLKRLIRKDTAIVCTQHINGEIGTIQPIEEISKLCRQNNIKLHVDAVQSFGKLDLTDTASLVDSLSISSHKIYGPKGIGLLYLKEQPRQTQTLAHFILKGNTIDIPSVVAFTAACEEAVILLEDEAKDMAKLRNVFKQSLDHEQYVHFFESEKGNQLDSIVGMAIERMDGQYVMLECNRNNFAISTGSACDVRYEKKTNTMIALQVDDETARQFFRVSFGRYTTEADVISLAQYLDHLIETEVISEVT
ncbi:IscS subfamily cysteine desulfurase [Alkalibacillus haloalkaliphilus]|uniref:IscS subfamily cysteine desulfurase n=1 Tax=Alkalibacillus haloalkaliphilus TaxID=94136 RepID=UPI0029362ABE|nr:IscS subfamily cysteine desulfurase [Alkalibacillus haloalkaliphilus]MDV2580920.1 IscS subfamily cysteine desulfurase [Alkalibacillus haloalkaliphilus]